MKAKPKTARIVPDIFPAWAPKDVIRWLRIEGPKYPDEMVGCFVRLLTDNRMQSVWAWHANAAGVFGFKLCFHAAAACRLPAFPGNLSTKERNAYLASVRQHATALAELLTRSALFRNDVQIRQHIPDDLSDQLLGDQISADFAWRGGPNYPDGAARVLPRHIEPSLLDLLDGVIAWTNEKDFHDPFRSSKLIENTKGKSRRVVYFTRTLYRLLETERMIGAYNAQIQFHHLATIANVSLELAGRDQVNEETVRKQVRRFGPETPKKPPKSKRIKPTNEADKFLRLPRPSVR